MSTPFQDRQTVDIGDGPHLDDVAVSFVDPLVKTIIAFLVEIDLEVEACEINEATFLPGIRIHRGTLQVDEKKLAYPGDLLHEAGHLAVTPANDRPRLEGDLGGGGGLEMAAIAWSYAALLHLGLPPEVVFHSDGYGGGSECIIDNFSKGRYVGVPILDWAGMTISPDRATPADDPYPAMMKWLRG